MEEKAFLLQQIEFLEFQLEDAKTREFQQKSMYESMIKSLSIDIQKPSDNQNIIQIKEQQIQFDLIQNSLKDKISSLEHLLETLNSEKTSLKIKLLDTTDLYEAQLTALRAENERKDEIFHKFTKEISEFEIRLHEKDIQISKLNKDIEELNSKCSEDIFRIEQDHNQKLQELKNLYQSEQQHLINKYSRLETEDFSKSACTYFTLMFTTLEKSAEKLKTLQKTLEKIQHDTSTSLSSLPTIQESFLPLLSSLPLKQKLDLTEKFLKLNSSTQQSLENFKFSLNSLRKIISNALEKEKTLKDQLQSKNSEIELMQRSISLKASQFGHKASSQYLEEIIRKDSEIISLKKIIGQLREESGTSRPPLCTPQHKRSKTLPAPFRLKIHTNLSLVPKECEPEEGQNFTTASTDRNTEEKAEIYLKKIENLRVALMKMKNQRDRAKNLSEKMLMELKEKKVELALVQEDFSEQKMMMSNQMKGLCAYLVSISGSPIIPKILKQDLVKVVGHYSQYT